MIDLQTVADQPRPEQLGLMTKDEARKIAAEIAKLPDLLRRGKPNERLGLHGRMVEGGQRVR